MGSFGIGMLQGCTQGRLVELAVVRLGNVPTAGQGDSSANLLLDAAPLLIGKPL